MPREEVTLYVDLAMDGDWGDIKLYTDPEGQHETNGQITVGREGAIITFARLPDRNVFWSFWNLTIHPLGRNEDVVDLDWYVNNERAVVRDTQAAKKQREFSYTLALEHENGTKYYLDPKLVNTGGGGGG